VLETMDLSKLDGFEEKTRLSGAALFLKGK
jgi:hypothetical protein